MQGDDRFDIVDEDGNVIGSALRRECHGNPELLHRVIHVMITNGRGDLLLQKRSPDKDIQPGRWDTSVGGHLDPGETVDVAALRELGEEVGVKVGMDDLGFAYSYIMRNAVESELISSFELVHEGPFRAQPEEITDLRFWTRDEIAAHLGTGTFTPNFEDEYARYLRWKAGDDGS